MNKRSSNPQKNIVPTRSAVQSEFSMPSSMLLPISYSGGLSLSESKRQTPREIEFSPRRFDGSISEGDNPEQIELGPKEQ
jgi:hypothetical protein